jgi:hypothetical protein
MSEKLKNIAEDILVNLVVAIIIGLPVVSGIVTYMWLNQMALGIVALIFSIIAGVLVFVVEILIILAIP